MGSNFRWLGKNLDGSEITLKRFQGNFLALAGKSKSWFEANRAGLGRAVALDVETTGLNAASDSIIEIAAREVFFDKESGEIVWVGDAVAGLQDPGHPIPPEITRLTGIRDEDVRGQAIDWSAVNAFLDGAAFIFAHNAGFDRPFVEKKSSVAKNRTWACTYSQYDWHSENFPSKKLEILAIYHGFFSDAHRALGDVDALIHLVEHPSSVTGKSYFSHLLTNHRIPMVHMIAANSPFESKDSLKQRGYSWDAQGRHWHKKVPKTELDSEIQWMEAQVYRGRFRGIHSEIPLERNFS